MEISLQLHPSVVSRQISLFLQNFVLDLDLRFPEGRKRRLLELSLETPDQILPQDPHLKELREYRESVSFLDWPILFEWNERWQQTRMRILVHQSVHDSDFRIRSSTSRLTRGVLQRLSEIENLIRAHPLPDRPTLLELLKFRWEFSALRDEVDYLVERLKKSDR
jgi:hypothetical protein